MIFANYVRYGDEARILKLRPEHRKYMFGLLDHGKLVEEGLSSDGVRQGLLPLEEVPDLHHALPTLRYDIRRSHFPRNTGPRSSSVPRPLGIRPHRDRVRLSCSEMSRRPRPFPDRASRTCISDVLAEALVFELRHRIEHNSRISSWPRFW